MTYEEYKAQRFAGSNGSSSAGNGNQERAKVTFANEFLKKDGATIVVRFPYTQLSDIPFTPTHNVDWPGFQYGKRVACAEEGNCPLCAQGIKQDIRVFVKFLTYTVDATGNVVINNTIWDRPAAFADIDLKTLFDEYGDISKLLFKLKRSGTGTNTRYTLTPIINTVAYPANKYVADFTELNTIDPKFVCTKSIKQYREMKGEKVEDTVDSTPVEDVNELPWEAAPAAPTTPVTETPVVETPPVTEPVEEVVQQPRRQVKYKF